MPASVPTDEIYERYLKKAISEINELGDELARAGDELRIPVVGSGHPLADIMLLKFSPQPAEIQEGVAFFGRSGQAVLKSLQRLHVDPMSVYGTNCLKFGTEDPAEAAAWLTRELYIVQPKLVVAMGDRSVEFFGGPRVSALGSARRCCERRDPALHPHDPGARDARHRRGARRDTGEDRVLERLQGARPLVGGAATILRSRRGVALVALLVVLVVYGAVARHLPELPSDGLDVAFYALVVLPAFAASIWLALPSPGAGTRSLFVLAAVAGVLAVALALLDLDSAANVAKLACYALAGFTFLSLFEELWWLTLVAVLVPWVDIWSVAAGPTEYVVEERPGLFEGVAIAFPSPGESAVVNIGPPDILFFALFLAAADRFGLRVTATWIGMTACLAGDPGARLVVGRRRRASRTSRRVHRVPRPERRSALARRSPRSRALYRGRLSADTDSTCGVWGNMSTGRQRSSS